MAAAPGVVGYSLVSVVDMACDIIRLPAGLLLVKILAELACELHYWPLACCTEGLADLAYEVRY